MSKRGAKPKPRLNARSTPEQIAQELAQFSPDDPFRDLMPDGYGIDFMIPLPPWDDITAEHAKDNLAILRVDPTHTNAARMEISIVRTIAGDFGFYDEIGQYIGELLLEWDAETTKTFFNDVLRMKQQMEQQPHRHFLAYRAYLDFLEEFGFQPTKQRLAKFIQENLGKYPVGLPVNINATEWWDMFFGAGLSRLNEGTGI